MREILRFNEGMKPFAVILAISALAVASQAQLNLHSYNNSSMVLNGVANSRQLLPTSGLPSKNSPARSSGVSTSRGLLNVPVGGAPAGGASNNACPEPASLAALAVGVASVVRRRKAARA